MKKQYLALAVLWTAAPAFAGVLPGVIGQWKLQEAKPLDVKADRPLWDEYGLQESEQGTYALNGQTLHVEVWRLLDSTGSVGAFDALRPADARPFSKLEPLTSEAALLPTGALVSFGNYLVRLTGPVPDVDPIANLFRSMPRFEQASLPVFLSYLPSEGRIANSERYIGGPVALRHFAPELSPAAAGFHLGAEAAVADYRANQRLVLLSYPTPSIARDRMAAIQGIQGTVVKRSGPLLGIVLHSQDADAAENLLAQIRWRASVTTGEKPRRKWDNPGNLLLNIFLLILILAVFCVVSGVVFGVLRVLLRRAGPGGDGEEILTLHLESR